MTVAALFVSRRGPYWGRDDVDAWDEERDARQYLGPYPVVAHPPCARWCRLARLVESRYGLAVGDDEGCFASALASIRTWGGVLEHPAWSIAWAHHGLIAPFARGWHKCIDGSWVCEVAQAAYGHRAQKLTWLFYVGANPPAVPRWERPRGDAVVSRCADRSGTIRPRLSNGAASRTPPAFAEHLLNLARNCGGRTESDARLG